MWQERKERKENILLSSRSHSSKSGGRTEFDQPLEVVLLEEDILSFNPPHGGGELVRKELDQTINPRVISKLELQYQKK